MTGKFFNGVWHVGPDTMTQGHAVFLKNVAAKNGDFTFPHLSDHPPAETMQVEVEEHAEPMWVSALVVIGFAVVVGLAVCL